MNSLIEKNERIFVAGHNGMVGSAILRLFKKKGYKNIICKNRRSLDLLDQKKTFSFLKKTKPDFIIIAAAKVGGIMANQKFPVEFLLDNLKIQNNLIEAAWKLDNNIAKQYPNYQFLRALILLKLEDRSLICDEEYNQLINNINFYASEYAVGK